jgi:pyridinium-3,5-biscarboxylic acid mononucleotide sulfurtransferase
MSRFGRGAENNLFVLYYRCMDTKAKYEDLKTLLLGLKRVVVCYSGGVDSTLLLKASIDALGTENVLALIGRSDTYPEQEISHAVAFAASVAAPYEVIETKEMTDESYLRNTEDRCYHCKQHLFRTARKIGEERGFHHVIEGSNVDDQGDYRPGRRAGLEAGVISPLLEAGLTKTDIRHVSEALGLPTHDKPSLACLASRIPYGTRIDPDVLQRIDRSEEFLRSLGIRQVRVRYHGHVARIEVPEEELDKVMASRDEISEALKKIGFLYVTLDLKGYRTGSMNEVLPPDVLD